MPSCRVAHWNTTPPCPRQQPPMGPLPRTSCQHPKVECTASVKRANLPAAKSKRHGWMTPTAQGQLSPIRDGSTLFRSLTPTPIRVPQFTSTSGKAKTKARVHSLSRDSDSLAGPMIRWKSSHRTLGGHFLPLHPFPASQGPNQ